MTAMPAAPAATAPAAPEVDAAELERLGITRVASEHFLVGPYRYGKAADAIAEAKRGRAGKDQR